VAGCGGGGSSSSNGDTQQGTITPYTPSATVLAAKQTNYATAFYDSVGLGSGCSNVSNTTVYLLPNTTTYAAAGVSELSQQQAAEYAEQAIGEIRATLGLSATTGFNGSRVQICAQTPLILGVGQGSGAARGFIVLSTDSPSLVRSFLVSNFDMYKKLVKHELVHTYQLSTLAGGSFAFADTWFTEGLAEYIASGKSSKTKADIMALVAAQNPVAVITNGFSTANLQYYPAFQSTVAYLFDPNGAKNNLSVIPTFLATLNSQTAALRATCTGAACGNVASDAFVHAFESTFKEADATAMKLRTGANNLQDTLIARLNNFLN
jgi:hypothetical protein